MSYGDIRCALEIESERRKESVKTLPRDLDRVVHVTQETLRNKNSPFYSCETLELATLSIP